MKTAKFFFFILCLSSLLLNCDKDEKTGTLEVQCINLLDAPKSTSMECIGSEVENPWVTDNLKFTILDIYVSQGVVEEGNPDNLTWYKIGENTELKFWNEYSFTADNLPVGEYKSMKANFRNIMYRYAYLQSDPSVRFEGMENMLGWGQSCSEDAYVPTNYFSEGGNHILGPDENFMVINKNEKFDLFTIEEGQIANVYWILGQEGADTLDPCTFTWIDANLNGIWDCELDTLDFQCPEGWHSMFDFIVEYE
ncbi:MAG: hypothetical protein JW798_13970 [Prolixibacteraceae bacterium]|nr:hypothetical protein [Prolixibacteraceae bacterium]